MKRSLGTSLAAIVVVAEILSLGLASASAQTSSASRREVTRQQRIIQEQQRAIEAYRRQLSAQQQAASQDDRSFLDKLYCPKGYSAGGRGDCYPIVPGPFVVVPAH